jgi:ADP-heptose:LPS heptosyltransferase
MQPSSDPPASSFSRPVVFFANGIGDHVLVLPAMRALCEIFGTSLRVICMRRFQSWFMHEFSSLEAIASDFIWENGTRYFNAERMAAKVGDCDLLISLVPWHSRSIDELVQRLRPAHSIGVTRHYKVRAVVDSPHAADIAFGVPRYFDPRLKIERFSSPPVLPRSAGMAAAAVLKRVPEGRRVLIVHTDTKNEKMWSPGAFRRVVRKVLQGHRNLVAMPVGLAGLEIGGPLAAGRILSCLGAPLATTMALVGGADFFLGVDSFALHVADLNRVPGVGLFGPTKLAEFGFRFGPHRHVCGNGRMCDIPEGVVVKALEQVIEAFGSGPVHEEAGRS